MERKISSEEIEEDLAELVGALKTLKKSASVEKVLNNIIANVRFQTDELQKREEELEKSRTYFQRFFNASPTPLALIGLDGKRMDCNPAMERLAGRSKKELTNVPVEATYAKEEQPLVKKKLVDETIEKGYMYGFETYFMRPDGTRLPIVANCSLLRGKDGEPLSIIYSATDITVLKDARDYAQNIIYSVPNPMTIMSPDGVRTDANPACTEYFGRSKEVFIGIPLEKLYDNPKKVKETLAEAKRKGVACCETNVIKGDGSKAPTIICLSTVRNREGNIINIIGTATDITKLRKQEEELEESNAFLEDLIDSHPSMLGVLDEEGKWTRVNSRWEKIWGWKSEEMLGKQTKKQPFMLPERIKGLEEKTRLRVEKLSRGEIVRDEALFLAKDGTKRVGQFEEQWIKHKGKIIGRVLSMRDITEERERKQEQANAVSSLSKVLGETVQGDLSARVDTRGWSEELATIGMAINTLIETLEFEKKEKS